MYYKQYNWKAVFRLMAILIWGVLSINLAAIFAGGNGTENDPWQIETAEHLNNIRYLGADVREYFIQTADIDLGVAPWNEDAGWVPIPRLNTFNYNGNGHKISNLKIYRPREDNVGLFGVLRLSSYIKNLALENVTIIGGNKVGAIAGTIDNNCMISSSYVTGYIQGKTNVGGFTGEQIHNNNLIINSYNAAHVHSIDTKTGEFVGGFAGNANGEIINSYNMGKVTFAGHFGDTGILAGYYSWVDLINTFWNIETTGRRQSFHSDNGLSAIEMTNKKSFKDWDFEEIWTIGYEGKDTYPYLRWQEKPEDHNIPYAPPTITAYVSGDEEISLAWTPPTVGEVEEYIISREKICIKPNKTSQLETINYKMLWETRYLDTVSGNSTQYIDDEVEKFKSYRYYVTAIFKEHKSGFSNPQVVTAIPSGYGGGKGTADNPYRISTAEQLNYIRYNSEDHYMQTTNINMAFIPNWKPLNQPPHENVFIGSYNGNSYKISNLNISRPDEDYIGLFGAIGSRGRDATLRNIYLENVNINGGRYVGGLVGIASSGGDYFTLSVIDNCHIEGNVYSTNLSERIYIGGLMGYNDGANIRNSSTSGTVTALENYVGGFLGYNDFGSIETSFATNDVIGKRYVGGFVGYNKTYFDHYISNSYATGNVTGTMSNVGGFIGYHFFGDISNCYAIGNVEAPEGSLNVGGFAGRYFQGETKNCYWDIETTNQPNSPAGIARTTDQMTYPYGINTFTDWDFENLWVADSEGFVNDGYPYLYFQFNPHPRTASNPIPRDGATDVDIDLQRISWDFIPDPNYTVPNGFRVYMNETGEFEVNSPFVWVEYEQDRNTFHCYDILPSPLENNTTYYWQVIATVDDSSDTGDSRNYNNLIKNTQTSNNRNIAPNRHIWSFSTPSTVDLTDDDLINPSVTKLNNNYPNPFNPVTNINFDVADAGHVTIEIFNNRGQIIRTLVDCYLEPGNYNYIWDTRKDVNYSLSSGIYFFRMKKGSYTSTNRMIMIK